MRDSFADDVILNGLKHNDRNAFNRLFSHFYPRLMAYVSSMMGEAVAEDITQDVFLYVWENRHKLYVGKGFHAYLYQTAYTRSLDHIKKNKHSEAYQVSHFADYLEQYASLSEKDAAVLEELYSRDFFRRLYQLLDDIPAQRREVFLLTYINGMKAKEIAENLHMPQRTVESHIYLTIKYLKERMSKNEFYLFSVLAGLVSASLS